MNWTVITVTAIICLTLYGLCRLGAKGEKNERND